MSVVRLIDRAPVACSDQSELFGWLKEWAEGLEVGGYGEMMSLILVVEGKDGNIACVSQSLKQMDLVRLVGILTTLAHTKLNGGADISDMRSTP